MDSQPLSLEDPWRLRVASAQVYSIMKNRHTEHFERVMGFLEATYRLLPRLVAPIKHMKIMFGLKTMVWKYVAAQFVYLSVLLVCCSCSWSMAVFLKCVYILLSASLPLSLGYCCSLQAIMWMLRAGRGMVDTVFKINQFFPSKLPQYQDHCVSVQLMGPFCLFLNIKQLCSINSQTAISFKE